MDGFVIDLTHGGVKIATELSKLNEFHKIYAFDLYNTLKKEDEFLLESNNISTIKNLEDFKEILINKHKNNNDKEKQNLGKIKNTNEKDLIINPIHSPLQLKEFISKYKIENHYKILSHHKAVKLILEKWKEESLKQNINTIEITGVKGKTSTVFMLKDIFLENNENTLILSSLGSYIAKPKAKETVLKKNISITPANIINTIELANPKCNYPKCTPQTIEEQKNLKKVEEKFKKNKFKNLNYDSVIFENSLGGTGLGDIGILTNIVENYTIAKGKSNAKEAKEQIFDCKIIVANLDTLNKHYSEKTKEITHKLNSFSMNLPKTKNIENNLPNVYTNNINYNLDQTTIDIQYNHVKTINNEERTGNFTVKTFAPGKHHVSNVLSTVTAALSLNIEESIIKTGLANFKGIAGRTSQKQIENSRIIEEINPGINTKAIENSINMLQSKEDYYIILGGKYGVTCEEIDEIKLSNFLNEYLEKNNLNLILTDELGESLKSKIKKEIKFIKNPEKAKKLAISKNKDILFIYRSNYSQISKR